MKKKNPKHAERIRSLFYDGMKTILPIRENFELWNFKGMDNPIKMRLFTDQLGREHAAYHGDGGLDEFVKAQKRFVLYAILLGDSYSTDRFKLASLLVEASEHHSKSIYNFERQFGAILCIRNVATHYPQSVQDLLKGKPWNGHRVVIGSIAFQTKGSIDSEELNLVPEEPGRLSMIQIQEYEVQLELSMSGKKTFSANGVLWCNEPDNIGVYVLPFDVSSDLLCHRVVLEYQCRKGLF